MIDLKQLQEDSYASAMRRYPKSGPMAVLAKIHEECDELRDAFLATRAARRQGLSIPSDHCPELTAVEEECADVLFALLVFAKLENINIEKALRIKNEFNKVRL